jgi:hypothetical protein
MSGEQNISTLVKCNSSTTRSVLSSTNNKVRNKSSKSNEHRIKLNSKKKDSRGIRFKKDHLPGFDASHYKNVNIVRRSHELPLPKSILRK